MFSELPRVALSSLSLSLSLDRVIRMSAKKRFKIAKNEDVDARVLRSLFIRHQLIAHVNIALRFKVIRYICVLCVYRSSNAVARQWESSEETTKRLQTTEQKQQKKDRNNRKPKGKMNQTKQSARNQEISDIISLSALIHYNFLAIYVEATLRPSYNYHIAVPYIWVIAFCAAASILLFHSIYQFALYWLQFKHHTIWTPFQLPGCLFAAQQMPVPQRQGKRERDGISVDIPLDGFAIAHHRAFMCNVHRIERHYLDRGPRISWSFAIYAAKKWAKKLHINCRKKYEQKNE